MDDFLLSEDADLSGVYSTNQAVHITQGVSVIACALVCTSYALCSSVFHNKESQKCILVHGFHFPGEQLISGGFWRYFRPVTEYRVTITTGRRHASDTDATVFLTILGSKGNTSEFRIEDKNLDHFEKGSIDTFIFGNVDVGEIDGVEIHRNSIGIYPGWFLASVRFTKNGGLSIDLDVKRWIGTSPLHLHVP